jgi:hypothetical protein
MVRTSFVLVAALAALAAVPVSAQGRMAGQNNSGARGGDIPPSWTTPPERTPYNQCLVNKVTKKRECHTRAEWRRVARKLEKQQAGQASSAKP